MANWQKKVFWIGVFLLAFLLRFWGLTYQSFWLDECQVMMIIDPTKKWEWLFYFLNCCEYHPPFFYILEKMFTSIFGYNDFVARLLPAIGGMLSIGCMYLLGKELFNKPVGWICACLTTVNYYNIWYAQDVRNYIFAFLISTLSYLFFIKLVKDMRWGKAWSYILFSLLLLYTHYFGTFVFISQAFVALVLFLLEPNRRKSYLRVLLPSGILCAIGFLPWLSFILSMSKIDTIWMELPKGDWVVNYFFTYFGNAPLLKPFLVLFLLAYFMRLLEQSKTQGGQIINQPTLFSFIIVFFWIVSTYFFPYLRSILVVPMLLPKYTIVALPAFLIIIAAGLDYFKKDYIKYLLLIGFMLFSIVDLIFIKKHYINVSKTQFKEMTAYISGPEDKHPIINEKTAWQHQYYLKQFGNEAPLHTGNKSLMIDSIIKNYLSIDTFWLVGAHGDPKLSDTQKKSLEDSFFLHKERQFYDAWAQLYMRRKGAIIIDKDYFDSKQIINQDGQAIIVIWAGSIQTKTIALSPGRHRISLVAMGTPLEKTFPVLKMTPAQEEPIYFSLNENYETYQFDLSLEESKEIFFDLSLENDAFNAKKNEDRNVFIRQMIIKKIE